MSRHPSQRLALVIAREAVESHWESERWTLIAALPDPGGEPRTLFEDASRRHRLFPGFEVTLFPDEAHGYFLNVTTDDPSVFASIRIDEATGEAYPYQATMSYNEAARWMDGSERVERTSAWPELIDWMGAWVEANYKPEEKREKRFGARSFKGQGRIREEKS